MSQLERDVGILDRRKPSVSRPEGTRRDSTDFETGMVDHESRGHGSRGGYNQKKRRYRGVLLSSLKQNNFLKWTVVASILSVAVYKICGAVVRS